MIRKFILIIAAFMLVGCTQKEDISTGGKVDYSNDSAPKTIESKDITEFSTEFYIDADLLENTAYEGKYTFEIKDNILDAFGYKEEVNDSLMSDVQTIIDRYSMVENNGINCYTSGLPYEYQPCYLDAVYESGEELYFRMDNDPDAFWTKRLYEIFRTFMVDHGHEDLEANDEIFLLHYYEGSSANENSTSINRSLYEIGDQFILFCYGDDFDSASKFLISDSILDEINEVIEKNNMTDWENETNYDALDGYEYSISFVYNNQMYHVDSGMFPVKYEGCFKEIRDILEAYIDE